MTYLPGESAVVRYLRLRKAALLAREAGQVEEMTRAWLDVERALDGLINDLVNQVDALVQAGIPPTQGQIYRLARYYELLVQAEQEIAKYVSGYLSPQLIEWQREIARMGLQNAIEAIEASYISAGMFGINFNRLPISAVELLVGLAGDGSPLLELLKERVIAGPEFAVKVMETLIEAVALGYNPRKTARMIKDALTGGLNKALQIARSEQLRVMREASLMQYFESGVVEGYMRLSARDDRVCPACLFADDGKIYELDVEFEEHPQGRCVPIPVLFDIARPDHQHGKEWFLEQSPEVQEKILGKGRYKAWKEGRFKLEDLITRRYDTTWGNSLVPTSLKDLLLLEEARIIAGAEMAVLGEIEPGITGILQSVLEDSPGFLSDLDFRLKSVDSLARKMIQIAAEEGISLDQAMRRAFDKIRYTAVFDPDILVDGWNMVAGELMDQGYSLIPEKFINYFGSGGVYEGLNTVWFNPDTGAIFELQFHTPISLFIKTNNHVMYELARVISDQDMINELMQLMTEAWDSPLYELPTGYDTIGPP